MNLRVQSSVVAAVAVFAVATAAYFYARTDACADQSKRPTEKESEKESEKQTKSKSKGGESKN